MFIVGKKPCKVGSYSTTGYGPCTLCPIGYYSFNSTTCKLCPSKKTTIFHGATHKRNCTNKKSLGNYTIQCLCVSFFLIQSCAQKAPSLQVDINHVPSVQLALISHIGVNEFVLHALKGFLMKLKELLPV